MHPIFFYRKFDGIIGHFMTYKDENTGKYGLKTRTGLTILSCIFDSIFWWESDPPQSGWNRYLHENLYFVKDKQLAICNYETLLRKVHVNEKEFLEECTKKGVILINEFEEPFEMPLAEERSQWYSIPENVKITIPSDYKIFRSDSTISETKYHIQYISVIIDDGNSKRTKLLPLNSLFHFFKSNNRFYLVPAFWCGRHIIDELRLINADCLCPKAYIRIFLNRSFRVVELDSIKDELPKEKYKSIKNIQYRQRYDGRRVSQCIEFVSTIN